MKLLLPSMKEKAIRLLPLFSLLMVFYFQLQAQPFPLKTGEGHHLATRKGEPFFICAASYSLDEQSTDKISYNFSRLSNLGINALFVSLNSKDASNQTKGFKNQIKLLRQITRQAYINNLLVLIYPEDTSALEISGKSVSSKFKAFRNVIWVLNPSDFTKLQNGNGRQLKAIYLKHELTDTLKSDADFYIADNKKVSDIKCPKPVVFMYHEPLYSDSVAFNLRKIMYGRLLQGSSGVIINQNTSKKWSANNPFYYQLHLFRNIFDTISLKSFKPAPHNLSPDNSAAMYTDKAGMGQTVLYHCQLGMFSLNLSSYKSQLKIKWVQPSTGKAFHSEIMPYPAEQLFLPPFVDSPDWLIFIKEEK